MHKRTAYFHVDWLLVLPVIILVVFSLLTLLSINIAFFKNQLLFFILGSFLFLFFSHINYRILQSYVTPIYIISFILLLLLSVVGFESRRGAVRWVTFFGFALQFSELLKPFLILCLSAFLTTRPTTSFKKFGMVLILLAPIAFLIYRQPDLGTAIIYVLTVLAVLLVYGFPWWWFVSALVSVIISIPIIIPYVWKFLNKYQRARILTFFHLSNNALGTSWNVNQSIISVGSGGFFGKGLGQGTQSALKFLPERQTDFLFASLSEMLGFVGVAVLIVCFALLLYRCFVLIQHTEEEFCKVFMTGAFFLLLIQFFVNVGMNIGILPIVGVTFPFVSYGGSSFIANAILLGLVSGMSKKHITKQVLEIR